MQYKLAFLFALMVCSQALTFSESTDALYTINDKRWQDLCIRMNSASSPSNRDIFLKSSITTFAFTCEQVLTLISTYAYESDRVEALTILKDNILDIKNKDSIITKGFNNADNKKKATDILITAVSCKAEGVAPEKFPVITLPYKDQWSQTDLEALVKRINKAPYSSGKIQIAEDALTSSSNILTSEQACFLYESFVSGADMLAVTEFIKDKIVGLTCDQVISVLNRFSFQKEKLEALKAFKHNIIDFENKLTILDTFTYTSTKDEARKVLDDLKPKSYIFGQPTGKVVFLLDASKSMYTTFTPSGGKNMSRLDFMLKEFAKTISNFDDSTEFTVFSYSLFVSTWKNSLQKATQANIADAINFSSKLTVERSPNIYGALEAAYKLSGVDTIYLFNSGCVNLDSDVKKILDSLRYWNSKNPIKVNTIAFLMGTEQWENKPVSRKLMSDIAEITNGIYRAVESNN